MATDRHDHARPISGCRRRPGRRPRAEELTLEQAEKLFIQKVLARHGGDVRKAAEQLGMSRSALYRRLQQFGVCETMADRLSHAAARRARATSSWR